MTILSNVATTRDVYTQSGVLALGDGWYPAEEFRGLNFRWCANDAVIYVATINSNAYSLKMALEPGPGLGLRPFELQVFDQDGTLIAKPMVRGKQDISIPLPPGLPKVHALHLKVEGGGKTALNDTRELNFRVFEVALEQKPIDIFPAWAKLGGGWYTLESFGGTTFRWANNHALVEILADSGDKLCFDVEPGPGVDSKPFVLNARDSKGARIGSWDVATRRSIVLPLPNRPISIEFSVDGGGKPTPGESRHLNFRVFSQSSR